MILSIQNYLWEQSNEYLRNLLIYLGFPKSGSKQKMIERIENSLINTFPIYVDPSYTFEEIYNIVFPYTRPYPTRVSGIQHIAYFRNINSKINSNDVQRILLLGERHVWHSYPDSIAVSEWIFHLARTAPVCLDVSIETDIQQKFSRENANWNLYVDTFMSQLKYLQVGFDGCDVYTSSEEYPRTCPYPNVRYRKIDLRVLNGYNIFTQILNSKMYALLNQLN